MELKTYSRMFFYTLSDIYIMLYIHTVVITCCCFLSPLEVQTSSESCSSHVYSMPFWVLFLWLSIFTKTVSQFFRKGPDGILSFREAMCSSLENHPDVVRMEHLDLQWVSLWWVKLMDAEFADKVAIMPLIMWFVSVPFHYSVFVLGCLTAMAKTAFIDISYSTVSHGTWFFRMPLLWKALLYCYIATQYFSKSEFIKHLLKEDIAWNYLLVSNDQD